MQRRTLAKGFLTAAAACSFGKSEAPKWESRGDVRVSGDNVPYQASSRTDAVLRTALSQ